MASEINFKLYEEIENELLELTRKREVLEVFLKSEDSDCIDFSHKQLLICQNEAMRTYGAILASRMYLIINKGK